MGDYSHGFLHFDENNEKLEEHMRILVNSGVFYCTKRRKNVERIVFTLYTKQFFRPELGKTWASRDLKNQPHMSKAVKISSIHVR